MFHDLWNRLCAACRLRGDEQGDLNATNEVLFKGTTQFVFTEVVQLLLASGARIDIENCSGLYPGHVAARHGHVDCLRAILAAGMAVNQPTDLGMYSYQWNTKFSRLKSADGTQRVLSQL